MANRKKRISDEEFYETFPPGYQSTNRAKLNLQDLKVNFKFKNESQKKLVDLVNNNKITIVAGPAGTGKTYLACAQALKLLKNDDRFKKIILVKSVTVLEGEEVGFLKGDLKEKMLPFTISFLDNFHKIIGEALTQIMVDQGYIEVLPLAFIRGRSIDNAIIIVDEAQNITLKNMRSTMTRIGTDTKMIITGDTKQIDMKNPKLSSLDTVVKLFGDKSDIGTMNFEISDIVRDPIVKLIEETFDDWEEKQTQVNSKKS
jgi:phosphate starvation-inducible protein PhoH and related proteins